MLARLHDEMDLEEPAAIASHGDLTDPREFERSSITGDDVVIESTGGLGFRPDFAGLLPRLLGFAVDQLVVIVGLLPGFLLIVGGSSLPTTMIGGLVMLAVFVALNVWYARSVASDGRWIGNRIASTRVVDARNGATIDVGHAAARFAVRHLVSTILLLGFLPALFDSQRRTFHDQLAGSIVVGRPRASWSVDDNAPAPG